MENLNSLPACKNEYRIAVRVPLIAGYNTKDDVEKSVAELRRVGVSLDEKFTYRIIRSGRATGRAPRAMAGRP